MSGKQSTMNISLPQSMREWVEQQIAAEGFGTASEYFRALLREAQKRKSKEELDRKLIAVLDSGEPTVMTPEDWQHIRQTVRGRLAKRAKNR